MRNGSAAGAPVFVAGVSETDGGAAPDVMRRTWRGRGESGAEESFLSVVTRAVNEGQSRTQDGWIQLLSVDVGGGGEGREDVEVWGLGNGCRGGPAVVLLTCSLRRLVF